MLDGFIFEIRRNLVDIGRNGVVGGMAFEPAKVFQFIQSFHFEMFVSGMSPKLSLRFQEFKFSEKNLKYKVTLRQHELKESLNSFLISVYFTVSVFARSIAKQQVWLPSHFDPFRCRLVFFLLVFCQ